MPGIKSFLASTFGLVYFIGSSFVSAATYSNEFASCVSTTYVLSTNPASISTANAASCANYCYGTNPAYKYSAWQSGTQRCGCATNTFAASATVTGNSGGCGTNYEVWITHTTFDFSYCIQNYAVDNSRALVQSSTTDFASIFSTCAAYGNIAIYPTTTSTYLYSCGFGYTPVDLMTTCGRNVNRIYFHPADATASGLSRRASAEKRRLPGQEHMKSFWCPKSMTACQLENDPASYECIDTESGLESCGGCLHGGYSPPGHLNSTSTIGKDCSSMYGVSMGHSSCIDGLYQFDCMRGWKHAGDKCIKAWTRDQDSNG
ncbi:hypothetical protein V866_002235 [Kwoniella sp. B9012]